MPRKETPAIPQPSYQKRSATPKEALPNSLDMNTQKKCWVEEKIGDTARWVTEQAGLATLTREQQKQALCMLIVEARRLYLTNKTPENSQSEERLRLFAALLRTTKNINANSQSLNWTEIREKFCSHGLFQQPDPRSLEALKALKALLETLVETNHQNRSKSPQAKNDTTATPPLTPRNRS